MSKNKTTIPLQSLQQCTARLLAAALLELYPEALLLSSESHRFGFQYDFLPASKQEFSIADIELRMQAIAKEMRSVTRQEMLRSNAIDYFLHHNQTFKASLLQEEQSQLVEAFRMGDFLDVFAAPFVRNAKEMRSFQLTDLALLKQEIDGRELSVIRISGIAFSDRALLKQFLKTKEKAKECDHRLIGENLQLFSVKENGFFWFDKGVFIRQQLKELWRQDRKEEECLFIQTPSSTPSIS